LPARRHPRNERYRAEGVIPFVKTTDHSLRRMHETSPNGRVGDWRAGLGRSLYSRLPRPFGCEVSQHRDRAYVSSPRHIERRMQISHTTLTCLLRIKGYGAYPAGATFG
jgi:hypothetical protein